MNKLEPIFNEADNGIQKGFDSEDDTEVTVYGKGKVCQMGFDDWLKLQEIKENTK